MITRITSGIPHIPCTILSRYTIWCAGFYGIIQGLGITAGGPIRWAGPAFTTIRQVPASPYSWGIALMILGVAVLVGSATRNWTLKAVGLFGMSVWCGVFAIGALKATYDSLTVATTGGPTYLCMALIIVGLICVDEGLPRARP